jgi:excisionase family DNA binding protein
MTEPLMKMPEVAALLGLSRSMVWKLTQDGRLPEVRIGRALRFRREDVERIAREGTEARTDTDAERDARAVRACPDCDDSGYVVEVEVQPTCCRRTLPSGECCGNPDPEQVQVQEPCPNPVHAAAERERERDERVERLRAALRESGCEDHEAIRAALADADPDTVLAERDARAVRAFLDSDAARTALLRRRETERDNLRSLSSGRFSLNAERTVAGDLAALREAAGGTE